MANVKRNWRDVVTKSNNYLDIGYTEVYLDRDDDDFPWDYVNEVESGGSHRMDIATTVRFTAKHPCGIKFSWCLDIEPYSASGKSHYEIDAEGCRQVLSKLKGEARKLFKDYLKECAAKVKQKADEWHTHTVNQYRDAEVLRQIAEL